MSLSASVLDFGCVEEGTEVTHTLQIINSSAVLAYYQFDVDTGSHSVFNVDQPCGTLPGNSKLTLRVKFRPHHPIAHHKTLTCLLLHRVGWCIHTFIHPSILSVFCRSDVLV